MRKIIIFMLLAAGLLLLGCINPNPPATNTTSQPPILSNGTVVPPANTIAPPTNATTLPTNATAQPPSNLSNSSVPLPPGYPAAIGDTVTVDYTLRVDGKVLDTSNATLANESGILNPNRRYAPITFKEDFNSSMIPGFIIDTVGMTINETVSFQVDPARGYGLYDPKKVLQIPRYYDMNMSEVVPRPYLESQGVNISNGTGYYTNYGTVFIQDYNDQNVTIFYLLSPGQNLTVNGIPEVVTGLVGNLTARIEYALDVNKTYQLPNPTTGAATVYKVLDKTNQTITLDSNNPLANKTLDFTVTMRNIVRGDETGTQ